MRALHRIPKARSDGRPPQPAMSWLAKPYRPLGRYRRLPQQFDNASLRILNRPWCETTGNDE